jgi:release factor glutamine methyltransferase
MPDVRTLLAQATASLGERVDAEVLLLHVLDKPRSWLFSHADDALDTDVQTSFSALVERRRQGEPVAYITGRRGFWSMDLEVTSATLIPRPETELLVELVLQRLLPEATGTVVDLGTGSGAIALAIASERPRARIIAIDTSADALAIARRNAVRVGVSNVRFLQGDWFAPLHHQQVDLIVSNPPYIEASDPHLDEGDLRFEPVSALASGADGLDDIRHIVRHARDYLRPGGWLLIEHGWHQGMAVRSLMTAMGMAGVSTARDLESRDRVTFGAS